MPKVEYFLILYLYSLAGDCGDLPVVMVTDTPLRSHNIMSWQTKTSDSIPNLDVGDIISAV